jgi:SRSO17 transposase
MGERGPQGTQRLLNAARWDADAVRDDLRNYVVEHLGDEHSGVLVVDETGFLKKGEKSVGVARQYTGTAGKKENAQVGVFLAYASKKGTAFVDRSSYLPREWTEDAERRAEAGVPQKIPFATKGELAKEMLRRAFEAGVPARWVVAETVYGTARGSREWLEEQQCSYVLAVPATKGVYHEGTRRRRHSRWPRTYPLRHGRGFRPVRAVKESASTTGPAWRSLSPKQPPRREGSERVAGWWCAATSTTPQSSPTTWRTGRSGRLPGS